MSLTHEHSQREPPAGRAAIAAAPLTAAASTTWAAGTVEGVRAAFAVVAGQRQLFLDDHGVARMANLRRALHRPGKRGAVLRSPTPGQTIQTRSAPAWDPTEKVYKLWVLGIDASFWRSRDGLHWTPGQKPDLRTDLVVRDPKDSRASRRYKAALANEGFAVSRDGVHWARIDAPRIPSSDEANLSYDPAAGLFIHTVKRGGKYGRSVAIAVSRDFEKWTDHGVVFEADELDQRLGVQHIRSRREDPTLLPPFHDDPDVHRVDVYNMGVFHYEGLYIGMPAMYHATGRVPNYPNTDGFHLVQLAMSRDLKTWKRLADRRTFIGPSRVGSGAYDLTQILPPSAPVVRENELWFYYTGLKYRASYDYVGTFPDGEHVRKAGLDSDHGAVCLAVLRRDGFVSLDATEKEGRVESRPFRLPAKELLVNVDASGGELRAEILDSAGEVVARSAAIRADAPRARVTWEQGGLTGHQGREISLRLMLSRASLYSYWFE